MQKTTTHEITPELLKKFDPKGVLRIDSKNSIMEHFYDSNGLVSKSMLYKKDDDVTSITVYHNKPFDPENEELSFSRIEQIDFEKDTVNSQLKFNQDGDLISLYHTEKLPDGSKKYVCFIKSDKGFIITDSDTITDGNSNTVFQRIIERDSNNGRVIEESSFRDGVGTKVRYDNSTGKIIYTHKVTKEGDEHTTENLGMISENHQGETIARFEQQKKHTCKLSGEVDFQFFHATGKAIEDKTDIPIRKTKYDKNGKIIYDVAFQKDGKTPLYTTTLKNGEPYKTYYNNEGEPIISGKPQFKPDRFSRQFITEETLISDDGGLHKISIHPFTGLIKTHIEINPNGEQVRADIYNGFTGELIRQFSTVTPLFEFQGEQKTPEEITNGVKKTLEHMLKVRGQDQGRDIS